VPILAELRRKFNLQLFLTSEDGGKVGAAVVRDAFDALNTEHFLELCELVRSHGKILELNAHRLEGCECHKQLWTSHRNLRGRREALRTLSGHPKCFMKGRQAVWFQSEGLDLLLAEISECTSTLLAELMTAMAPSPRANLVRMQAELAESLKEEISDKYNFHRHVPYSLIKVFYGEMPGGRDEKAREFAREALAEYDSAVAAGKADSLHRVAHLFGKGLIRQELDQFVSSVLPLRVFFPLRTPW